MRLSRCFRYSTCILATAFAVGLASCSKPREASPGAAEAGSSAADARAGSTLDDARPLSRDGETGVASGNGEEAPLELVNAYPMPLKAVTTVDDWVYFSGLGNICRVPKVGGEPEMVAPWDGFPWGFAVTRTHVCWPNAGNIDCLPRSGGAVDTIDLDGILPEDSKLGTDGTELYFYALGCPKVARLSASHELRWVVDGPLEGSTGGGWAVGDGQHIYCITETSLLRLRTEDGEGAVIASGFDDGGPVAQSADEVFWIQGNRSVRPPQEIKALPKSSPSGEPRHVTDTGSRGGSSGGLVVDEARGRLYWTRFDTVMSAPIGGGEASEVWADAVQIYSIAADEDYLYWTTTGPTTGGLDGRVMKLRKPDE
jgi:hypothetical protein